MSDARDGLDLLVDDAREGLGRHMARSLRAPCLDDVIQRARALDRTAVAIPPSLVAEDGDVVDIRRGRGDAAAADSTVAALVVDARAAVARKIARRRMDPAPAPPMPARGRSRFTAAVAFAVAVAAVVTVGVTLGSGALAQRDATDSRGEQAARAHAVPDEGGRAEAIEPQRPTSAPTRPQRAATASAPAPVLEVAPQEATMPSADAGTRSDHATKGRDRFKAMADAAQAKWRAGDLDGARAGFQRIVAEGGRSRQVELAYADLFALARQRGSEAVRAELWRAYLRRFPHGRFADDARAGLCRAADDRARAACWDKYLEAFPRGSYRAEATAKGKP